jgi:hypothetical protein
MKQWYFREESNQKIGPLTPEEFEQRVASGEVEGHTRVWCSGLIDWTTYDAVLAHQCPVPPTLPALVEEAVPIPAPTVTPTAVIAFENCLQCRKRSPAHLFQEMGNRRLCGSCILEAQTQKQKCRGDASRFRKYAIVVAIGGLILAAVRIGIWGMPFRAKEGPPARPADAAKFEPWVKSGPANWPQIALTSEARFRSGGALHEASAFLVESPDGDGFVVIAAAAPFSDATLHPPVTVHRVGAELVDWRFFPKAHPEQSITLTKVCGEPQDYSGSEAIVMAVARGATPPAQVLKLRDSPLRKGETVFVVTPSKDPAGKQIVAKGIAVRSPFRDDVIFITTDLPLPLPAIAGGAVIDLDGHLVAIATGEGEKASVKALETSGIRAATVGNFAHLMEIASTFAAPRPTTPSAPRMFGFPPDVSPAALPKR